MGGWVVLGFLFLMGAIIILSTCIDVYYLKDIMPPKANQENQ